MKSISTIEYELDIVKIRVTDQFKIENAIMSKNAMGFKLACSFLLFKYEIIS